MKQELQINLAKQFKELHHVPEMLILPNAWDAGSAVIFEKAGFSAIGTTSAGVAFALGYPDGQKISLSDMIQVESKILDCIHIPLTVDVESGYGINVGEVTQTVKFVIQAGAVGINLEDGVAGVKNALIPLDEQCLRIEALEILKADMGIPFFINARTDMYWLEIGRIDNRLEQTIDRCKAYIKAGADAIFVPGHLKPDIIQELVHSIDVPLNVLLSPSSPKIDDLKDMGVARVSLGSGPVRAALGLTRKIAYELLQNGSFTNIVNFAIPYDEMNQLFEQNSKV